MEGIIAGALAVVGTLLGSVIAHHYQERSARQAEARAQYDQWSSQNADPLSEEAAAARAESYRLYVETRSSASRLKLISSQTAVQRLAEQADSVLELTSAIIRTDDRAEMLRRGSTAQQACDAFVARANAALHG
ncbi:hypothetical protein O1L60_40500 [Streptomyces diastatochromogenes]|nr:hypothetical protein [Streptomyces diastatochromogenes]